MKALVSALFVLVVAVPGYAAEAPPSTEKLLSRLRPVYAQPTTFWPGALRYPLHVQPQVELAAARTAALEKTDIETQRRVALLAEEVEDPGATDYWRAVLGLTEAALKKTPGDTTLMERQVEAMIGADVALRGVPAAEKLAEKGANNWRWQMLLGDAYFRRADFNWRVLSKIAQGTKALPPTQLLQLNGDLAEAEKAYARAVALAPAEGGPRGGRMALSMARPVMASTLPSNAVTSAKQSPVAAAIGDLVELVRQNPNQLGPLWHTAHFLALQPTVETTISQRDREMLEKATATFKAADGERALLLEARGLFAVARRDWAAARVEFAAAVAANQDRSFAADWLGLAEVNSQDAREQVIARLKERVAAHATAADWTVLGMLQSQDEPRQAVAAFRKAIELDVDRATPRYNLAILLARMDPKSPEVIFHLKRVLEIQPDDREARFAIAVLDAVMGRLEPSRRALRGIQGIPDLEADLRKRVEATLADLGAV